jgi:hypothetical protein
VQHKSVVYVGGKGAKTSMKALTMKVIHSNCTSLFSSQSAYFIYGAHMSSHLMDHGRTIGAMHFQMDVFRSLFVLLGSNLEINDSNVDQHLCVEVEKNHAEHLQQYQDNMKKIEESFGKGSVTKAKKRMNSILHYDLSPSFELVFPPVVSKSLRRVPLIYNISYIIALTIYRNTFARECCKSKFIFFLSYFECIW